MAQCYGIYQYGYSIYGIGFSPEDALKNANEWLEPDDQINDVSELK